jgi:hypothetical protein
MVNYQLGKIYKIVCNVTGLVYVGSTCEPTLAKRLTKHVCSYRFWLKHGKKYMTSYKILEKNDYEIILIEPYPCNNKDELYARERQWTNQIDCVNKMKNQGLQNELGGKKEVHKLYYITNKSTILDKLNKKCQCECGGKYTHCHKTRHIQSNKHKQYIESLKYQNLKTGLYMINKLDEYFNNNK